MGAIGWAVDHDSRLGKILALQVDVNSSSRCAGLAKLHFSPVSQFSGTARA